MLILWIKICDFAKTDSGTYKTCVVDKGNKIYDYLLARMDGSHRWWRQMWMCFDCYCFVDVVLYVRKKKKSN